MRAKEFVTATEHLVMMMRLIENQKPETEVDFVEIGSKLGKTKQLLKLYDYFDKNSTDIVLMAQLDRRLNRPS